MNANEFNQIRDSFSGTECYYDLQPLSHLKLTDGAKWLLDQSSVISDIAGHITYTPKLFLEGFLAAKVVVASNGSSTYTIDDGDGNILFKSDTCHYDLPAGTEFMLFSTNNCLMLAGEY